MSNIDLMALGCWARRVGIAGADPLDGGLWGGGGGAVGAETVGGLGAEAGGRDGAGGGLVAGVLVYL